MKRIVLIFGVSLGLFACVEPKEKLTKADVIQMRVEEKVEILLNSKRERCTREALERASAFVDSILIAQAKASKDTLGKPPRPIKPERPEIIAPTDSTPVQPFLRKDTGKQPKIDG